MKDLVVVIPIYKDRFDNFELVSLRSTFEKFNAYPITFVCPKNLNIEFLDNYQFIKNYSVVRFDDFYFKNIDGYNHLMLANEFYQRFEDYTYLLICQTDVYVFKDDLKYWINSNYDYIGAPWIATKQNSFNRFFFNLNNQFRKISNKKLKNTERIFKVGNGGFSLRKVSKFIEISNLESHNISNFIKDKHPNEYHIEDLFWSLYAPKIYKDFKIPDWKTALKFCIDRKPKLGIKLNGGNLPMACHGFNKKNVRDFWQTKFKF